MVNMSREYRAVKRQIEQNERKRMCERRRVQFQREPLNENEF